MSGLDYGTMYRMREAVRRKMAEGPDYRPCNQILTDPDGFTARCMVGRGIEHSHHDMTARESVTAGNQVIDGRGVLFDADGYEIDPPDA